MTSQRAGANISPATTALGHFFNKDDIAIYGECVKVTVPSTITIITLFWTEGSQVQNNRLYIFVIIAWLDYDFLATSLFTSSFTIELF